MGQTSNIQVTLREDKQQLILKIRDDGVGFPTHQHLDGGLKRMQERVSDFNGNFMLHQLESKGCEIHIAIPL
ncbi:MAG: sensor histidine kinase, partial [Anaerolineae bacterium]|nr:sensor histidine kinase [Anaerolineae bacterium]